MPLVVLDPIVLVNTAKSPMRTSAKLLTLLAYGRTSAYLQRVADAESAEAQDITDPSDLEAWGKTSGEAYSNTLTAHALLEESIPVADTGERPQNWRMAVSRELLDRVGRRV